MEKSRAAQESILAGLRQPAADTSASAAGKLIPMECDLASLASVRRFAADFQALSLPLDVLVCNAGVALGVGLQPPPPRTADGFELTVGTNHLGHFLLSCLLAPALERAGPGARLVVTASQVRTRRTRADADAGSVTYSADAGSVIYASASPAASDDAHPESRPASARADPPRPHPPASSPPPPRTRGNGRVVGGPISKLIPLPDAAAAAAAAGARPFHAGRQRRPGRDAGGHARAGGGGGRGRGGVGDGGRRAL